MELRLTFNPTYDEILEVVKVCFDTPEKVQWLNINQPFPAPNAIALSKFMDQSLGAQRLSAVAREIEEGIPVGYIFCGSFFPPTMKTVPHMGFGINMDLKGTGYGLELLNQFIQEFKTQSISTQLYGHCLERNIGACKTMEKAGMTGTNVGIQQYSNGNAVLEYVIR